MQHNIGDQLTTSRRPTFTKGLSLKKWQNPKLFAKVLSVCLIALGGMVIELPSSPVFAAEACVVMRRDSRGDSVRALQQTLLNNGYNVGAVDGVFGEMTEITVKSFQRQNDLDPDGVVGPATCRALVDLPQSELMTAPPVPQPSPTPSTPAPTPQPSPAPNTVILKPGDSGPSVTALQNALRARRFVNQSVTGTYDEETENTVKRLQLLEGLPVTGEVDATTQARLNEFNSQPAPDPVPVPTQKSPSNPGQNFSDPSPSTSPSVSATGRYQVVVPLRGNEGIVSAVRQVIPGAPVGETRLGRFVEAGSYDNRFDAESLSQRLKARGFDARVVAR